MTTATDRLPPHNTAAERSVLGGILRDPECFDEVQQIVGDHSFYLDAHQRIFGAMAALVSGRQPIDMVTLHELLTRRKVLEDIGGPTYIGELWSAVATGANAVHHAKIVRDAALARGLIHAATEILRDAYDRVQPANVLLEQAEQKLFDLAAGATRRSDIRPIREFVREALDRVDSRIATGNTLDGLPTGLGELDQMLGGLRGGQLIVIGARPSVGKTALALTIAENVTATGTPAVMFSLEMPGVDIGARVLSMESGVSMTRFTRANRLEPREIELLTSVLAQVENCPLYLDEQPNQTASRIASATRSSVRRHGVKLALIDYLQIMDAESKGEYRSHQVGEMAQRLKQVARECNIPVILLSQLTRESENRSTGPDLRDLRESGDIEAHADAVVLLERQPKQGTQELRWLVDAHVRKNRNGPIGSVPIAFLRSVMRFENAPT